MPFIQFPDIPDFPGVPPLAGAFRPEPDFLLTSDASDVSQATAPPQWGIFKDGEAVVVADSVVSFGYDKEYRVADFPIEGGSFASYNKVERPYETRLVLAKGGGDSERAAFLASLKLVEASLDLYSVYTPDQSYSNANVVRVGFDRTSHNGVTLILADVLIQEIRVASDSTFSNTASPSGLPVQSIGSVQAVPPTQIQESALTHAPTGLVFT